MKGVVAKLVCVKDSADATALEVAAGGKLYQVIVDTEATAKALLSKGQLRKQGHHSTSQQGKRNLEDLDTPLADLHHPKVLKHITDDRDLG